MITNNHHCNHQVLQPTITPLRWCPSNRSRPFLSKNLETIKYWKSSRSIVDSQSQGPSFFSHLANPWRTPSLKNPSSFSPSVNVTFARPSNLITNLISSWTVGLTWSWLKWPKKAFLIIAMSYDCNFILMIFTSNVNNRFRDFSFITQ